MCCTGSAPMTLHMCHFAQLKMLNSTLRPLGNVMDVERLVWSDLRNPDLLILLSERQASIVSLETGALLQSIPFAEDGLIEYQLLLILLARSDRVLDGQVSYSPETTCRGYPQAASMCSALLHRLQNGSQKRNAGALDYQLSAADLLEPGCLDPTSHSRC